MHLAEALLANVVSSCIDIRMQYFRSLNIGSLLKINKFPHPLPANMLPALSLYIVVI